MELTIDNITDNENIKRLLRSDLPEDVAIGIQALNRDPLIDFEFKLFLYTCVSANGVSVLYDEEELDSYNITLGARGNCENWKLIPK